MKKINLLHSEVKGTKAPDLVKVVQEYDFTFNAIDGSYFKDYGISLETLQYFKVRHVKTVYANEDVVYRNTKGNPIFLYTFLSGRVKIYRPLADKKSKWRGNAQVEDINGESQIAYKSSKLCFITSSMKDVMMLYELGYNAIAFNGEGYGTGDEANPMSVLTREFVKTSVQALKQRFEHVVLFYDHDSRGIENAIKISKMCDIRYITTCSNFKDPSDYSKKYGKRKLHTLIKKRLSKLWKNV